MLVLSGCSTNRSMSAKTLYGTPWELEVLSGPEVSLKELFPDILPKLQFDPESQMVSGNSGCNGYTAPFELKGGRLEFGPPGPSTLMYCGEGELLFRKALERVDSWELRADGKLLLRHNAEVLLVFTPTPAAK
jgi:heat shock protein HslJ